MKRKNFVKLTAMVTAVAVAISPAMVFAADTESADDATTAGDTINGEGGLEGIVNKDVFKVVLPAVQDTNFTLDPQGLLKIADSTNYGIGPGAIYFKNTASDGTITYTGTSDAIEILNKSSYDIDVAFSVKVELPEGVTMAESEDALTSAKTPSVYLEMKEAEDSTATALKVGDNAAAVKKVDGVAEDANNSATGKGYYINADTSGSTRTYTYKLGSGFTNTDAKKASYTLSGKCDSISDWSAVNALDADKKNVKTTIVWSAKKHEDVTAAHGSWSGSTLWISKDADTGFSTTGLTVEVSDGGTTYTALTSGQYSVSDAGWVSITYNNLVAGLGSAPTGTLYIRVTDGTTKYVFENQ